jgi:hypothetical protein
MVTDETRYRKRTIDHRGLIERTEYEHGHSYGQNTVQKTDDRLLGYHRTDIELNAVEMTDDDHRGLIKRTE